MIKPNFFLIFFNMNRVTNNIQIPADFDWKIYLELNKDICKFPHYRTQSGAILHWKQFGYKEGRSYKYNTTITKTDVSSNKLIINDTEKIDETIKCIVMQENKAFNGVKKMILSKYRHLPKYNNYLIVLGYNIGCEISNLRKEYPNKKIVIYQLEQLYDNKSQWYNINSDMPEVVKRTIKIQSSLKECDEIWDYDVDNIKFLKSEGFKNILHVPLFYSEDLKRINDVKETTFDLLFFGSINERRAHYLRILNNFFKICIISTESDCNKYKNEPFGNKMIKSKYDDDLFDIIFKSKIIINLHYYDSCIQEQVRMFDLLINDKLIISEKSLRNYYGDLIIEFYDENDMISKIKKALKSNSWVNPNVSEKFKNLYKPKKNFKVGAIYNTFYGLELIEDSILSIRDSVDYIVLVHQKKGFNGGDEPKINKYIINYLLSNNIVDDIIYYDNFNINVEKSVLEKRNIGLEYCKKNKCDYIIPLDCDELYNSDELTDEINTMNEEGIDTLYSPIYAYYYDENHYFKDTYYVPSVYKVDNRKFEITASSVLVDPVRKMKENKYKISTMGMHHFTYLKDNYFYKINNRILSLSPFFRDSMKKILDGIINFSDDKEVPVLSNDLKSGVNILTNVRLIKK